ncbi:MAG: cupin domain-containing protein, partial [Haloarculaceae archaeon]
DWQAYDEGDARFRRKRLAGAAGGDRLGASLYELSPGERAWPYHYHTANEEAMYVLAGSGRVRGPDGEVMVIEGDYLAFPVGEGGGHHVANDGDEPMRYLMLSTMVEPDVTVYPDSGTFGVYAGAPPGSTEERSVSGYYRLEDTVDYWEDNGDDDGSDEGGEAESGRG